jgi:hypothetical protein
MKSAQRQEHLDSYLMSTGEVENYRPWMIKMSRGISDGLLSASFTKSRRGPIRFMLRDARKKKGIRP